MIITTQEELHILQEAGKRARSIMNTLLAMCKDGVYAQEIDNRCRECVKDQGGESAFLNYTPEGMSYPYPAAICVSINDEIVHGIPKNKQLHTGDLVSLDMGFTYKGLIVDIADSISIGEHKENNNLIQAVTQALLAGIDKSVAGNTTGDIGNAIEEVITQYGYTTPLELAGHGVGRRVHEDPMVYNYGKKGTGQTLQAGLVIAIEPMVIASKDNKIIVDSDEYTIRTHSSKRASHKEHTVVVQKDKAIVLT